MVGYGCMTCIGNSGPLSDPVADAIEKVGQALYLNHILLIQPRVLFCLAQGDLVTCGVLSGNRNFEGRIHPLTRANYLASPPLVIAYALAGTVLFDFENEPLGFKDSSSLQTPHYQIPLSHCKLMKITSIFFSGHNAEGKPIFLRDIWPSREEIQEVEKASVIPAMFKEVYSRIQVRISIQLCLS